METVNLLLKQDVGIKSLNDPIDTTTPQGLLVFNLFASLAEFARRWASCHAWRQGSR
ncbi:recombinase family protein [Methylicorpusculum oleiharenae]|nr:recombinase family protein [Methylicorpusculum oleiharenae]